MGADYYNKIEIDADGKERRDPIRIGANTRIHRAIVDKNARIGQNVVIDPGDRQEEDGPFCQIRDGIAVIPKGTVIPDNTKV